MSIKIKNHNDPVIFKISLFKGKYEYRIKKVTTFTVLDYNGWYTRIIPKITIR